MKFTNSMDSVRRVNVRVEYRLSVGDLARILANRVERRGIELDGVGWVCGSEELEGRFMVFTKVLPEIREELKDYGENSLIFDGDSEVLKWAVKQVETATGEKNTEGI